MTFKRKYDHGKLGFIIIFFSSKTSCQGYSGVLMIFQISLFKNMNFISHGLFVNKKYKGSTGFIKIILE
jgi:hypothetical protein